MIHPSDFETTAAAPVDVFEITASPDQADRLNALKFRIAKGPRTILEDEGGALLSVSGGSDQDNRYQWDYDSYLQMMHLTKNTKSGQSETLTVTWPYEYADEEFEDPKTVKVSWDASERVKNRTKPPGFSGSKLSISDIEPFIEINDSGLYDFNYKLVTSAAEQTENRLELLLGDFEDSIANNKSLPSRAVGMVGNLALSAIRHIF
jgi:hypothetical protein